MRLPRAIWTLGFVSLLMDVSSELVHALLPVFMVTTLHTSAGQIVGISSLASLQAMITSASRMEPPGWAMAATPWATATSTPSRKGKKPSDTRADPARPPCEASVRLSMSASFAAISASVAAFSLSS